MHHTHTTLTSARSLLKRRAEKDACTSSSLGSASGVDQGQAEANASGCQHCLVGSTGATEWLERSLREFRAKKWTGGSGLARAKRMGTGLPVERR